LDNYKSPLDYKPGKSNASCGDHSYHYVHTALELCKQGLMNAMVTAPICKESWHLAGHQQLSHDVRFRKAECHPGYTTHLPFEKVGSTLIIDSVKETIELGDLHLRRLGIDNPRIAVCGLNPHAGEARIFGNEEIEKTIPAINMVKRLM
jgi:4-phospho-D-threonate 3-dehydrogenase / 4-phospho-D-erythronate 3-dehydrogenase